MSTIWIVLKKRLIINGKTIANIVNTNVTCKPKRRHRKNERQK